MARSIADRLHCFHQFYRLENRSTIGSSRGDSLCMVWTTQARSDPGETAKLMIDLMAGER